MENTMSDRKDEAAWQNIAPLLDEALAKLNEVDRRAILLRYFEGRTLAEVGTSLALTEDTARKRVARALEKLRTLFVKRGVILTTTVIAGAVAANSVQAAPVGLAATISATAVGSTAATSGAMLANATLKTMTWLKVKFGLGVGVSILVAGGIAVVVVSSMNKPPSNPALARQMIQAIFNHVSSPLPAQMRFVAEVETVETPWTETQISNDVEQLEEVIRKNEGVRDEDLANWRRREADSREINMEERRLTHGGMRTFVDQEWLAGGLWRLDQLETTPMPEKLQAMYKPLPKGEFYEKSLFRIGEANFTSHPMSQIDYGLHSAWFGSVNWEQEGLWEAATLEESIGFIVTFAICDITEMMDLSRQAQSKPHTDIDSYAGARLDPHKLDALASGKDGRWIVQTDEAVLNGRKMAVLRLKGKTISLAHGEEIAFFADANHLTNIYRIELTKMPFMKTPHISIRDDFDTNGFPHTWIVETPNDEVLKKTVKFKEVGFPAQYDDKAIFSPEIPQGYSIDGRPSK